jgi:DNA-binding CsgD family transcriptional regulator
MRHLTNRQVNVRKIVMWDEKQLSKIAIALYVVIFILIALDLIGDYSDGIELSHILAELLVLLLAIVGIGFFGRKYYQATQLTLSTLKTDLVKANQQAQLWRNENHELIAGLGVEIQKQFISWELTNAEAEVGLLLLKGFSLQEIADLRQSSERTVREQARAVYRKSGISGRSGLSAFFLEDLLLPRA